MQIYKAGYPAYLPSGNEAGGFLRLNQVLDLIPVGKSTVYYLMQKGEFPKQIKLSPTLAVWRKTDIEDYIKAISRRFEEA